MENENIKVIVQMINTLANDLYSLVMKCDDILERVNTLEDEMDEMKGDYDGR